MSSHLFAIDPMAASSYGLYNSVKKEEGSFVDFLLSYDSKAANDSDNSWLSDLVSADNIKNLSSPELMQALAETGFKNYDIFSQNNLSEATSPEILKSFSNNGLSTMDLLSQKSAFDTQAEGYKQILTTEMKKRGIEVPKNLGADIYSQFKL